jgi:hypothetical protein
MLSNEKTEKCIADDVERENPGVRIQGEDAEAAVKQE